MRSAYQKVCIKQALDIASLNRTIGNTAGSNEARTSANNARAIADYEYDRSFNNFDVAATVDRFEYHGAFDLADALTLVFGAEHERIFASVSPLQSPNAAMPHIMNASPRMNAVPTL